MPFDINLTINGRSKPKSDTSKLHMSAFEPSTRIPSNHQHNLPSFTIAAMDPPPPYTSQLVKFVQCSGMSLKSTKYTKYKFTEQQKRQLNEKYEQLKHPNKSQREEIAKELDLTERSIRNWFQNKRQTERKHGSGVPNPRKRDAEVLDSPPPSSQVIDLTSPPRPEEKENAKPKRKRRRTEASQSTEVVDLTTSPLRQQRANSQNVYINVYLPFPYSNLPTTPGPLSIGGATQPTGSVILQLPPTSELAERFSDPGPLQSFTVVPPIRSLDNDVHQHGDVLFSDHSAPPTFTSSSRRRSLNNDVQQTSSELDMLFPDHSAPSTCASSPQIRPLKDVVQHTSSELGLLFSDPVAPSTTAAENAGEGNHHSSTELGQPSMETHRLAPELELLFSDADTAQNTRISESRTNDTVDFDFDLLFSDANTVINPETPVPSINDTFGFDLDSLFSESQPIQDSQTNLDSSTAKNSGSGENPLDFDLDQFFSDSSLIPDPQTGLLPSDPNVVTTRENAENTLNFDLDQFFSDSSIFADPQTNLLSSTGKEILP